MTLLRREEEAIRALKRAIVLFGMGVGFKRKFEYLEIKRRR